MSRSPLRLLFAVFITIALLVGGTTSPAGATSAQRAAVTSPSAGCQSEYNDFLASATKYKAKTKQVKKDSRRVKRYEAKAAKAKNAKQERRAERKLKKAKKVQGRHGRQQSRIKTKAVADYQAWQTCESAGPEAPSGPLQVLCDNGLPQAVCDAFDTLPLPDPATAGDSPIQVLCDNGLPQALCDAATLPGTGGASPLQPLCDAGLPQEICDASLPVDPTVPTVPVDPTDPTGPILDPLDPILDPICATLPIPVVCP